MPSSLKDYIWEKGTSQLDHHKIYLTGYLDVPADRWESVIEALPKHVELTLAEAGCLSFNLELSADVAHRIIVAEIFENQAAFDAHQNRTQASEWYKITSGIERHFQITSD